MTISSRVIVPIVLSIWLWACEVVSMCLLTLVPTD